MKYDANISHYSNSHTLIGIASPCIVTLPPIVQYTCNNNSITMAFICRILYYLTFTKFTGCSMPRVYTLQTNATLFSRREMSRPPVFCFSWIIYYLIEPTILKYIITSVCTVFRVADIDVSSFTMFPLSVLCQRSQDVPFRLATAKIGHKEATNKIEYPHKIHKQLLPPIMISSYKQ